MSLHRALFVALALVLTLHLGRALAGCAAAPLAVPEAAETVEARRAVVLISLDGFRWDYLDRGLDTPALDWVAGGVRASHLVPVFPTKTFPNHYSLVTGLHPETHGIVGNSMRDPERLDGGAPARFSMSNRAAVADGRWWGGEPIWVTAERQGLKAAPLFWPGSEAEIGGVRPSFWRPFDGDLALEARADTVLAWLDAGADYASFYVETVDSAGHRFGPDDARTDRAIERADAAVGYLLDGLRARGRLDATDIVVVSDHGMAAVSPERVVVMDAAVDYDAVDVDWGEVVGLWPEPGVDHEALIARVSALPHLQAMRRADVPARLRYRASERIPPIVVLVDAGWTASSQAYLDRRSGYPSGGSHGFDNAAADMWGIFLARGPHVRIGTEVEELSAVDVYNVLAGALGVRAAPNHGDAAVAARVLR